jgi:hypothetical protein
MRNKFTLEKVTISGKATREHFQHENRALLSFHVQKNVTENLKLILWDNRAGDIMRQRVNQPAPPY